VKTKIPTTTRNSNTAKILSAKILSYSQRIFQNFVTEKSSALSSHSCCWDFYPKGFSLTNKGGKKLNSIFKNSKIIEVGGNFLIKIEFIGIKECS
jgi:hypothetical protein